MLACADDEPRDRVYPGDVEPCDVDASAVEDADLRPSPGSAFHLPGSYFSWNTAPAGACRNNIEISEGDLKGKEIYVSYPTPTEPTVSGKGGIAKGLFPVIVFAHANHDGVCNIFEKYFSLQSHWATWGAVVFAVDGTDTNCQQGSRQNLQDRSDAQRAALAEARRLNDNPESMFYQRLDMDRVIFAGHSRGGGASHVSAEEEPDVKGVINLQGVDVTAFGFGSATFRSYPTLAMTAGNDVDVNYPYFEPTEDQLGGDYTWVNINGGIHAYTADTVPLEPDDPPEISRQQQHDITEYFTVAFLQKVVGLPTPIEDSVDQSLNSFDGAAFVKEEISEMGVNIRWRWGADPIWIDKFDGKTPGLNEMGGETSWEALVVAENSTYRPDENPLSGMYGKSYALHFKAESSPGWYRTRLVEQYPRGGDRVEFRVKGPDKGPIAGLKVVLEGSTEFEYDVREHVGPISLSNRFTQVVIHLDPTVPPIEVIRFEAMGGEIFVDDLRFYR